MLRDSLSECRCCTTTVLELQTPRSPWLVSEAEYQDIHTAGSRVQSDSPPQYTEWMQYAYGAGDEDDSGDSDL